MPIRFTPWAESAGTTITVNGAAVRSGESSPPLTLGPGLKPVDIAITAVGGAVSHYTILLAVFTPFVTAPEAYIKASNTSVWAHFGIDLAVSGDTLAVGAWGDPSGASGVDGDQDDTSAPLAGAVYVYKRTGSTWAQEAYLKASNARANAYFGITVAVQGDTIAVGSFDESSSATGLDGNQADTSAPRSGAVYVFTRCSGTGTSSSGGTSGTSGTNSTGPCSCGSNWEQQAYIKASNTRANAEFGSSVALSADTLVVGAWGESSAATGVGGNQNETSAPEAGAAYVFTRSGTTWTQQAYLKASNTRGAAKFGNEVRISGDTVAIGSEHETSAATGVNGNQADTSSPVAGCGTGAGAVYVFTRAGGAWSQQAYLKASNQLSSTCKSGGFGISLALSGDTLAVGQYMEASNATGVNGNQSDTSALNAGAVFVFTRTAGIWSQQAYLKASNTRSLALFGYAIDLDGDTLVIGSVNESSSVTGINGNEADTAAPYAGGAYVFTRTAGVWSKQTYIKASNTRRDALFAYAVSLSGNTIAIGSVAETSKATGVGGNQADTSMLYAGAAYVFH